MRFKWRSFLSFISIMTAIVVLVGGTTTVFLYSVEMQEGRERLVETARSQARLIEAIARFDIEYSSDYPGGTEAATLSQISEAHKNYKGFGETGEFTLARRVGDQIVFLLSHRHFDLENPLPVPFDSNLAEPMRKALSGRSGTMIGLDYRGEKVMAAFEPVAILNLGLVAKIDLAEIYEPFIKAGLFTLGFAIIAIFVGTVLFLVAFNFLTRSLLESEKRFRNLVEGSIQGIMIQRGGKPLFVNQSFAEIFGYQSPDEILGMENLNSLIPPQDMERMRQYRIARLKGEKAPNHYTTQGVKKDGTLIWCEVLVRTVDWEGEPAVQSTIFNITERKQAEEELRESEHRLKEAQAITQIGHWILNPETGEVSGSDELFRIFNLSREEATLDAFANVIHEDDREFVLNQINQGIENGESYDIEHRLVRRDGTERMVQARGQPITDETGKTVELVGTVQDITERKQAEEALKESEIRNRALLSAIPDLLFRVSNDGVILDYQTEDPQALFQPSGDFIGKKLGEVLPSDFAEPVMNLIAECMEVNETRGLEYELNMPKGSQYYFARVVPFQPVEVLIIVQNITERKLLEQQLRESQKLEAVGQLAGGIAHEFNNLLQMIMGFNSLTMDDTEPSDSHYENLLHVEEASKRGAALVSQLLSFSRRQPLQPLDINLNNLISSLSKVLVPTLGEHINLELEFDPEERSVHADRGGIEQVLLNLCLNAKDAMPEGGRLTLQTKNVQLDQEFCNKHPWAKPGAYVRISAVDTGVGISEEVMEHIFEPFFTTKGPQEGSGLGLSMVYGLIEQHHGLINVISNPGEGSTFEIYLPIISGQVSVSAETEGIIAPLGKRRATILVAEDEKELQVLTSKILEEDGHTVLVANNGEEAIRIVQDSPKSIDLILLDVVMPKMGGIEAHHKLKKVNPNIPIIFQTGYELKKNDADYISKEGLRTLQKPFLPGTLRLAVIEELDGANSARLAGLAVADNDRVEKIFP